MKLTSSLLIKFHWKGISPDGRKHTGIVIAKTLPLAKMQLQCKSILVNHIHKHSKLWEILTNRPIKSSEIANFSRQLSTLMLAELPLLKALEITTNTTINSRLKKIINNVKNTIESGVTLHEALRQHNKYMIPLFCNLVAAGEHSGTLNLLLERITTYQENWQTLKKLRKALSYPCTVLSIAIIVISILLITIIPQFESLFKNTGSHLPSFTKFVLKLAGLLQHYGGIIILLIFMGILSNFLLRQYSRKFHKTTDLIKLKIPIFGIIIKKTVITRFCHTMATTFSAGMPILNALEISPKTTNNLFYQDVIINICNNIATEE